eukprot:m.474237 g.474237  ORF g.474237 m.474237 type:complete len:637 (-) comp21674_c0_seq1:423-2333(-)
MDLSASLKELPPPPASFLDDSEIEKEIVSTLSQKLSRGLITKEEHDHIHQVHERGTNLGFATVLDVPPEFLESTTTDISPEHSPHRASAVSITSDGSDRTVFDDDTVLLSPTPDISGAETPERVSTPTTDKESTAPLITLLDDGKFSFDDGVTKRPKVWTNRQKIFEVFETTAIESRFCDLESIGKGATATIYKATRVDKGDVIALKRFKTTVVPLNSRSSRLASNEDDLADVLTEASVLQRCSHDNVLTMCAAVAEPLSGSDSVALWIALEYCFGSCYELLKTLKRTLTETEILALSCQVLSGLEYLHFKQIMHRDIKCGNVLISADRATAVLADFGVSKDMTTVPDGRCGTFVGSPYWIAPEVVLAMEEGQYSYPADVWSFGITVIEMAQKEPPLFHLQAMSALYNIPENDPPTLPADKNFSIAAHDFVDRCLVKDPDMRLTPPALLRHPVLRTLRARGNGTSVVEDMLVEALDARQALEASRSTVAKQRGADIIAQGDGGGTALRSVGAPCVSPPVATGDGGTSRDRKDKNAKGKPKGFFARHWRKKKRDRSSTVSEGSGVLPASTPDMDENELLSVALKANAASFVRRSSTMDVKTNPMHATERETVAKEMRRLREKSMKKPRGRGRKSTAI